MLFGQRRCNWGDLKGSVINVDGEAPKPSVIVPLLPVVLHLVLLVFVMGRLALHLRLLRIFVLFVHNLCDVAFIMESKKPIKVTLLKVGQFANFPLSCELFDLLQFRRASSFRILSLAILVHILRIGVTSFIFLYFPHESKIFGIIIILSNCLDSLIKFL